MPSSVDAAFFNERFDADILAPWARRTARLDHIVHHLALALGGGPAASFSHRLMMPERSGNDTALSSAERIEIKPRRTAPGSPRPETRLSLDRRSGKTPVRPHVGARARVPAVWQAERADIHDPDELAPYGISSDARLRSSPSCRRAAQMKSSRSSDSTPFGRSWPI